REDVPTMGLGSLEPVGSLAKTLRRCPVGLQLGHNTRAPWLRFRLAVEERAPCGCSPCQAGQRRRFASIAVAHFLCVPGARPDLAFARPVRTRSRDRGTEP